MTIDIFERYAALDPAGSSDMQPGPNSAVAVPLLVPDGGRLNMQTHKETPQQPSTDRKPRTGLLVAAATAALVLVVGAATLLVSASDSETAPAAAPTTSVPGVTEESALAVSNAFIVASNAGDVDAISALFAPGAEFRDNFKGVWTAAEHEMILTWNAAQGTTVTSQGCVPGAGESERVITVTCTAATHDALSHALPAPPVPTEIRMDVTSDGISGLSYTYGSPDFAVTYGPFEAWMVVINPEDAEKARFGSWSTIEEAKAFGELRVRYAAEWAQYLEENGCPFTNGC